jgi:hypothetical protein
MNRRLLIDHLAQAELHVSLGEKHIAGQRALIARLDDGQLDTGMALKILKTYLSTQKTHVADRDRLSAELACAGRARG